MPDHAHSILKGKTTSARPKTAIDAFKYKFSLWLIDNNVNATLQKDYYDHIIRKVEDWKKQVQYVGANPVRAGLVNAWNEYAFTGSIDCDLHELMWDVAI